MDCPVCKVSLTEGEVEGVGVHFCARCRGLLCSRESFRHYVSLLRESELEELSTAELFDRKALPEFLIPPEGKVCPGCGRAMGQFNYAYDSNIGYYVVRVPAFVFLLLWLGVQSLLSLTQSSIAYFAHIGGFVMGLVVALGYKAMKARGRR